MTIENLEKSSENEARPRAYPERKSEESDTSRDESPPPYPVNRSNYDQLKFRKHLVSLSSTPIRCENPPLLAKALKALPLERIFKEAEKESQTSEEEAKSSDRRPSWDSQDCVVRALLRCVTVFLIPPPQISRFQGSYKPSK